MKRATKQTSWRKRLIVEVESDANPVTGRIREGAGTGRRFSGWLELAAALGDAFRGDAEPERQHALPQRPRS